MTQKNIVVAIIILLCTVSTKAQYKKKIYLDEFNQQIKFEAYRQKSQSKVFDQVTFNNDTVEVKKLRFRTYFGKLNTEKKEQLNKFFLARHGIDSTKVWLIHHVDTLPNPKQMPKTSKIVYLDSTKRKHKHVLNLEDYEGIIAKERENLKHKKDIALLHFYTNDNQYPVQEHSNNWYKDESTILKRIFSDGFMRYRVIIVYPNGDFFLSHYYRCNEKELLRAKGFKKRKKQWVSAF
ncbi:hypothetical protein AWE51_07930 [Aquimarina aggregata]|uniref:Uncharacterized protein n=1 Tax=Aquimarina aggregata TaxID=1642818 RepID=A0A162CMY0_9FLAO|nr:hypothetical protein [Aquimarina aggregata]KZS39574.1 hypothetical protein AWE51_07930 [Aquimarina aggregata]